MALLTVLGLALAMTPGAAHAVTCSRTITAKVVVLDQPIMFNRLGAQNINGMIFALRRDVVLRVPLTVGLTTFPAGTPITQTTGLTGLQLRGNVQLRPDKRPRPLVLRVAEGDCLDVEFQNLLAPSANPFIGPIPGVGLPPFNLIINDQAAGRWTSFHAQGMQLRTTGGMDNDGSLVGNNAAGGLVAPGDPVKTYRLYAEKGGTFLVQSYGASFGSEGLQGNSANGLFGAINVEPSAKDAAGNPIAVGGQYTRFYRSQLTEEEMRLAADANGNGMIDAAEKTDAGQPILDYGKAYPGTPWTSTTPCAPTDVWCLEGKAGLPIISMVTAGNELVHSDINAIIAGPNADGSFDKSTYPLESKDMRNPSLPNRLEAFREFTVIFHDEFVGAQVFPRWYNDKVSFPEFAYVLEGVRDAFPINYGSGGIGSEIIANRLGIGPMHDCLTCAYEEFFLTSYAVGDPAMITDIPANFGLENCAPSGAGCAAVGPKANEALYPDDPSNVHHSYVNDRTVFRNLHVGKEQHIFHLHNNQWLFNPNDDNSNYLDAQGIGPGSGYTYEINFGGSGNRNKSAGDAIFHCHFYPHFAQGMWELWRQHDVYETGTPLQVTVDGGMYHANVFGLLHGEPAEVVVDDGTGNPFVLLPSLTADGAPIGARARSLPDGEVVAGTPIPAVVPLPGKALPVMPGKVNVVPKIANAATVGSNAFVDRTEIYAAGPGVATPLVGTIKNPGFPFWIASIEDTVGQRPTTPPYDMLASAGGFDGGLPRHSLDGITAAGGPLSFTSTVNARDFSKVVHDAAAVFFPETGTDVENAVIDFHSLVRNHPSYVVNLDGTTGTGNFVTNGYRDTSVGNTVTAPQPSAPFHEPCIDDTGKRLMSNDGAQYSFFGGASPTDMSVRGSSMFNAATPRVYKGANIQYDAILNKAGYHYPQQRILALWDDVVPTIEKIKPGEPLVMRMNTFDCVMYHHTNLVPEYYEMDDYQVRTPTDIIGQHIHLPKWDLTTSDGSANGWNYEDGTLAPGAVRERIHAINHLGLTSSRVGAGSGSFTKPTSLAEKAHPFFGATGPGGVNWLGARTTLQRWFADPVVNTEGVDRGLGIIFTHDHYGPSTHQQIGLYATVLAEPAGSTWKHNETGVQLGTQQTDCSNPAKACGGPTSWQAAIIPPATAPAGSTVQSETLEPFREFYFEFSDFQHAYEKGVYVGANDLGVPTKGVTVLPGGPAPAGLAAADTFRYAINPPMRTQIAPVFPDLYAEAAGGVLPGCPVRPCPQAIDVQDPGMHVVNYRNEPVGLRVYDPNKVGPDLKLGAQANGVAGDLAFALSTKLIDKAGTITPIVRAIPEMNKKDCAGGADCLNFFANPLNKPGAVDKNDPFTPMARAYAGDLVRVKIQAGGHEEEHNASIHGLRWLQAGSGHGRAPNSGWRNAQATAISEQFSLRIPMPTVAQQVSTRPFKDYAYTVDASADGWWSGMWGVLRAYNEAQTSPGAELFGLPSNANPKAPNITNRREFEGVCPKPAGAKPNDPPANLRTYDVVAILANDLLPNPGVTIPANLSPATNNGGPLNTAGGTLVYNPRTVNGGPIHDPTAILYVRAADLQPRPGQPQNVCRDSNAGPGVTNPPCQVQLKPGVKVEPLILRAAAGECVEVTLYNRVPPVAPDLPTFSMLQGVVKRDRNRLAGSTTFNNNLIRPSSHVGLHPQLVTFDVTQDDGTNVGQNIVQTVVPADPAVSARPKTTYRWYAGDLTAVEDPATQNGVYLVATPVEYGGSGLMPADKIKQGMKSLVGGLVILPQSAGAGNAVTNWSEDDGSGLPGTGHQAATIFNGNKRDFMLVMTKHNDQRYGNGAPVEHINGEGLGIPEDSQESTGMALNYGIEPLWFRFGITPNAPFGNPGFGGVANAHLAYSNSLVGSDPATPVFTAKAGQEVRLHAAVPHSTPRGSTFQLHGHHWQRDPYVCPGEQRIPGLPGTCNMLTMITSPFVSTMPSVGSKAIGNNPTGFTLGGQESIHSYNHFTFLFKAGGVDGVKGDFLFRDQAGLGNVAGLWGILRVVP